MITNFWNWIFQSVNQAVSVLNTMYTNSIFTPFFNLFLVIIATGVIIRFIIKPLIGGSGSDKAHKKKGDEEE